jgi:hypothetical protein
MAGTDIAALQAEIERLLATALAARSAHAGELQRLDERHAAELARLDEQHVAESGRRDELHVAEMARRDQLHIDELELFAAALESRDTIGQAKGIIMVTVGCSADEAFKLLRDQSQHENRKLVEIAADITGRAARNT